MPRRRLTPRTGQRAFTIVELVLVMLIMAIMAAVAAPKYRAVLAHYRVASAAGRVAADLRMIRQYARKTSTPQSVTFDATANTYAAPTLPDFNQPSATYAVNLLSSEYFTDLISASFGGSATAQFDIYGRPSAAGTVVIQSGSLQKTVQLDEAGHVRILKRRAGYTLVEVVMALGTGAVLMAGLAATLAMTTRGMAPDVTASHDSSRSSLAMAQIASDLRQVLSFSERTTRAVTFAVPDRTGDGTAETLRDSWSGTVGDPLLYQFNGAAAASLVTNVQQFNLSAFARTITATNVGNSSTIVFHAPHVESKAAAATTNLVIAAPAGIVAGNLMVAAVAVDGSVAGSLAAPAGWTLVNRHQDTLGQVSLAVWWKIATSAEAANYTFSWTSSKKAYGWIMRFSGVKPSAPINAWNSTAGLTGSSAPAAPTVTTTVPETMILRIGGFDDDDVTIDAAGVAGHTTITADGSDASTTSASGAAAYAIKSTAGSAGVANFTLTAGRKFVTFTLALMPDDGI